MLKRITLLLFWLLIINISVFAQWKPDNSPTLARLRGVSAPTPQVVWASGTKGTVLRSIDGGKSWQTFGLPDAQDLDFRDIQAFDANTVYVLSIGDGDASRIYKSKDGGKRWQLQFQNSNPDAFFDAFAFWDEQNGIAVSDPVKGKFFILTTSDGGEHWLPISPDNMPTAMAGESAFAASGTCLAIYGDRFVWLATGGSAARVFRSTDRGRTWAASDTPITKGSDSRGIFSIAFNDGLNGVIVGGDYKKPDDATATAAFTNDGGKTWQMAKTVVHGYRSCVAYLPGKKDHLIAVGMEGCDLSIDGGKTWKIFGKEGFHSITFEPAGKLITGWAVGENGKIAHHNE